jgi:hypothetical protein
VQRSFVEAVQTRSSYEVMYRVNQARCARGRCYSVVSHPGSDSGLYFAELAAIFVHAARQQNGYEQDLPVKQIWIKCFGAFHVDPDTGEDYVVGESRVYSRECWTCCSTHQSTYAGAIH